MERICKKKKGKQKRKKNVEANSSAYFILSGIIDSFFFTSFCLCRQVRPHSSIYRLNSSFKLVKQSFYLVIWRLSSPSFGTNRCKIKTIVVRCAWKWRKKGASFKDLATLVAFIRFRQSKLVEKC